MKTTTSMQQPMFLYSPLPLTTSWGESRQRIVAKPRALPPLTLSTDELTATKPEIVCSGVLALCFLYTFFHCFALLAS